MLSRRSPRENHPDEAARRRFAEVWPAAVARPSDRVAGWDGLDGQAIDDGQTLDLSRAPGGAQSNDRRPSFGAGDVGAGDVGAGVGGGAGAGGGGGMPPGGPESRRAILAAFDPGRRGVRALAIVAVLVVLLAAYLAWRCQPRAEPVVPASLPSSLASPQSRPGDPAPLDADPSPVPSGSVTVAVQGKVRHPGLVRLAAGARVADAIDAAGGALPGVDVSFVNLARRVADGELILIGVSPPPGLPGALAPGGAGVAGAGDPAGQPTGGQADGKINLNRATAAELDGLPGVGPVLAARIVEYRGQHGGFRSVDELRQVSGIGDAKFTQLRDRVTV